MKRRVLRAHSNKKQLRILSARFHLSHIGKQGQPLKVLCDASLLRAVLLLPPSELNRDQHEQKVAPGPSWEASDRKRPRHADHPHAAAATPAPPTHFAFLLKLLEESLGSKGVEEGERATHRDSSGHAPTHSFINLYYLPETRVTLRRLLLQTTTTMPPKHRHGLPPPAVEGREHGPAGPNDKGAAPTAAQKILLRAMDDLLRPMRCMAPRERRGGAPGASQGGEAASRNEVKALVEFIAQLGLPSPEAPWSTPFASRSIPPDEFYFVATQSHDVRKMLPSTWATLRLTTKPAALWLEVNDKEGCADFPPPSVVAPVAHGGAAATVGSASAVASRAPPPPPSSGPCPPPERSRSQSRQKTFVMPQSSATQKPINAADVAFMRTLSIVPRRPRTSRSASALRAALPSTATGTSPTAPGAASTPVPPRPLHPTVTKGPKRGRSGSRVANPNPLSVQKKKNREVFRVQE